ncbi:MAG: hypothetical protein ACKVRO_12595 [Micropepsaceae bacterium]
MNSDVVTTDQAAIKVEGAAIQAMLIHWTHQDTLYWQQIPYLIALQTAAYASLYAIGIENLSIGIMAIVSILSAILAYFSSSIRNNRGVNEKLVQESFALLYSAGAQEVLKQRGVPVEFQFGAQRNVAHPVRQGIFAICVLANLGTAGAIASDRSCGTKILSGLDDRFMPKSEEESTCKKPCPQQVRQQPLASK